MTKPPRELLDDATAPVDPHAMDPVAEMVQRRRSRRRRLTLIGAAVLAVLAAGGVVAVPHLTGAADRRTAT